MLHVSEPGGMEARKSICLHETDGRALARQAKNRSLIDLEERPLQQRIVE